MFRQTRLIPLGLRVKMKEEINRLVKLNVLKHIEHSEWGTSLVIVRKPNNKVRMCGNFKVTLNPAIADSITKYRRCTFRNKSSQYFLKSDLEGASSN